MPRKSCFLAWLAVLALSSAAFAQWNEEVLYSFQGIPDGIGPIGRIVYDKQGNLYGATTDGGASNCLGTAQCGTVYELSPPAKKGDLWTEAVLHVFQPIETGDGATPEGGLVMDSVGNLYGVTGYQGTGQCKLFGSVVGCGTVYEMSPPSQPGGVWTETVIYSFQGGNDGFFPAGDLVFDGLGNLYGVTWFGGGRGSTCDAFYGGNCGTVFELSPPKEKGGAWTEQVLYSFAGTGTWSVVGDGGQPNGGLVFDAKGNIYGTTFYGGTTSGLCGSRAGCGIAFQLLPPGQQSGTWTETVLYRFQGRPNDGVGPNGNSVQMGDALYGTTVGGGPYEDGIVFQLEPPIGKNAPWTENVIHTFDGTQGSEPTALAFSPDGTFYGAAYGSLSRGGMIFQLQSKNEQGGQWSFGVDYNFTGLDGYGPQDLGIVGGSGQIYGSTLEGGSGQACDGGCGTVFAVWP